MPRGSHAKSYEPRAANETELSGCRQLSGRERQLDPECRSPANLRCKVYEPLWSCTIRKVLASPMPLPTGSRCKEE